MGQVVTVTPDWLVLQDEQGKQYPVSTGAVQVFVIRSPTALNRVSPLALLEPTGVDRGSHVIATDHIDVYEGAARSLVTPGMLTVSSSGQVLRPIDFLFSAEAYGAPFPGMEVPIQGGMPIGPWLIHIVGPMLSRIPLQIGYLGENAVVTVVPNPGGFQVTRVIPGVLGLVRPWDLAYLVATQARPETLVL